MSVEKLMMMLAAAKQGTTIRSSDIPFDASMAAIFLRYEKLAENSINRVIMDHTSPLSTRRGMDAALSAYDRSYLLNLNIPYSGISQLCGELLRAAKQHKVKSVPTCWEDFANNQFDWESELESLYRSN